ncbi:MAG: hypothetical protein QXV55_04300 [Acidilobaceae archaeon]
MIPEPSQSHERSHHNDLQAVETPKGREFDKTSALVKILAFFAAQRNYGYIDRIGNALDEITVYEAIKDAVRDYHSLCTDKPAQERVVEVKIGGTTFKLRCPNIEPEDIEKSVISFKKRIEGKSSADIVKETRNLYIEVMAKKASAFEELRIKE